MPIPGWDEQPYCIVAHEVCKHAGLCENWEKELKEANPLDVVKTLEGVPFVKGTETATLARRLWVMAAAYKKQHQVTEGLLKENARKDKQLAEMEGKLLVAQCTGRLLMDKLTAYQHIAEVAATKVAVIKYKKRKGKISKHKVRKYIASAGINFDPDTWDGDVWDSDSSEDWDDGPGGPGCPDPNIDPPFWNLKKVNPISRREQITQDGPSVPLWDDEVELQANGDIVRNPDGTPRYARIPRLGPDGAQRRGPGPPEIRSRVRVEDYTQAEIADLISRFSQRSGELDATWLVRLFEQGAGGVYLDKGDSFKFTVVSRDPAVQTVFRTYFTDERHGEQTSLLNLVAKGLWEKYPGEAEWAPNEKPWYTIRDGIQRLKEEAMKGAVFVGEQNDLMIQPLTSGLRNRIIRTAPPAYKGVIMTLLLSMINEPIQNIAERMQELQDMGDWEKEKRTDFRSPNPQYKKQDNTENEVSRRDMFTALLKAGIAKDKIDGKETRELWKLYKHHVQAKPVKKQHSKDSEIPSAPPESYVEGNKQEKSQYPDWDEFKKLYPWEDIATMVSKMTVKALREKDSFTPKSLLDLSDSE